MDSESNSWSKREKYNDFMGRWSRKVAELFIAELDGYASIKEKNWLDVGCGTGALSFKILELANPNYVLGVDPSENYLPENHEFKKNVKFVAGNSENLPTEDDKFDIVVSALALNFMSDKEKSINEMMRSVKPNGIIGIYVWDYDDQMEFLRYFWDTVISLDSNASKLDEGKLFPICNPISLKKLFESCDIRDIITHDLIIKTNFKSFEEYWTSFLGGQGPAGQYLQKMSSNQKDEIEKKLRNTLPIEKDGKINLKARAFAIFGRK